MQDFLYTLAHPEYYEDISRYSAGTELRDHVKTLVPEEWELGRRSVWLHVNRPGDLLPLQGFKIHVSSVAECALATLSAIVPVLVERGVSFKLTADIRMLDLLNSKGYDRGGSGKFMTIYPADEAAFRELIEALHAATAQLPLVGPYILSDRRFRDSKILFYRYGGIVPESRLQVDGTRSGLLVAPDGSSIRDVRHPYFKLPEWVEDPFGGSQELEGDAEPLLGGRFLIESMLTASNRGGVYTATDTATGASVIIKEARPYINRVSEHGMTLDSTDLLAREFAILKQLEEVECTPDAIALFQEWEHTFLVQERIEADPIRKFVAQPGNLILPYVLREGVLEEFIPRFRAISELVLDAVESIHARGIILGDVSQNNVMVDETLTRVWLIDLESAVAVDDDPRFVRFSRAWYTPGFAREGRRTREGLTFEDDIFGAGMVLYNLFLGGLAVFELKPSGRIEFLDRLVELGVPAAVREAILSLLRGEMAPARDALRTLPSLPVLAGAAA
jgi:tRNA A-37 threonylcarbamoyl transferase component Bud32